MQTAVNRGEVQDEHVPDCYHDLVRPHIESFDYFLGEGMCKAVEQLQPIRIHLKDEHRNQVWKVWLDNVAVGKPSREEGGRMVVTMPRECREMGTTYRGALAMDVCVQQEGSMEDPVQFQKRFGFMPIMVGSKHCHLRNMTRKQLVAAKEEANEFGGIFICNGLERMIRMLIQQRRHFVMALRRGAYSKRGAKYTDAATLVRCVRPDQSSATVRLHYLKDGNVNFALTINRAEYFIPVGLLLKGLSEVSDKQLFDRIVAGSPAGVGHASFVADRAELALRTAAALKCRSRSEVLIYLGQHFRVALPNVLETDTDMEVGERLIRDYVFIHLERDSDRFALLLEMLNKLYALVNLQCCADNPDALTHHEILLPGQLLIKFFKEKMEDCLIEFAAQVRRDLARSPTKVILSDEVYVRKTAERMPDIGTRFEYFFNTGNLTTRSGLDLSQTNGFTIIAEKLNFFRYMSHFHSVHRGAYFQQMRTTTVRKLLPESWGFLCPVHTPDGAPCGLLNHLTQTCNIVASDVPDSSAMNEALDGLLVSLGMIAASAMLPPPPPDFLPVLLDGRVLGHVSAARAPAIVAELRKIKAHNLAVDLGTALPGGGDVAVFSSAALVPYHMEICLLPFERGGPYPGLLLYTQQARLARPVMQLPSRQIELVGSLEQFNMNIRCPDGGAGGSYGLNFTHQEIHTSSMLSGIASFTPFSDFNQSPRNMYQCQMGKQTMGTPCHSYGHRTDTKLYRIQTPQRPVARTKRYDDLFMDENPQGTNMVVCVISYTGYDMEDAMILNQSAVDRGLAHGTVYKTECIDLKESRGGERVFAPQAQTQEQHKVEVTALIKKPPSGAFGDKFPQNRRTISSTRLAPDPCHQDSDRIDVDGLPHVGSVVWPKQNYASTYDADKNRTRAMALKGEEQAVVQQVTLLGGKGKGKGGSHRGSELHQRANITLRLNRNPCVGDKFASRAGQKGVLGQAWPDVDMPYCARTGVRPDLIINPHAFPSRMTIGMLVESMASKAAVLEGRFVDATPFQKCDDPDSVVAKDPVKYFGDLLEAKGFARHGQETMISGYTGEEMPCDIFIGLVYYQRLRHMVKDKFQVRSTGKNNQLTRQPVKGRQMGGGIRFGEMERDSLLAHGAAYLLHDRLHYCSDYYVSDVCTACGSMLTPLNKPSTSERLLGGGKGVVMGRQAGGKVSCMNKDCQRSNACIERVALPYVFKYLASELAAMNIKVTLTVK